MTAPIHDFREIHPPASPANMPFHPHQTPPGIGSTLSSISPPAPRATSSCMHLKNMTRCIFSQTGRLLIFILRPISWVKNWICPGSPASSQLRMYNQNPINDHHPHPMLIEGEEAPFFSLPISHDDRANIHYIITTLANTNCLSLAWHAFTLKSKGRQINHLHPLKFLEYILQNPELVQNLKSMQRSIVTKLQWDGFLNGSIENLDRNAASLSSCYPGFAHSLRVNPSDLAPYIRDQNWENMIRFLIDVKLGLIEVNYVVPVLAEPPMPPPLKIPSLSEPDAATVLKILTKYAQSNLITTSLSERAGDLNQFWNQLENTEILSLLNHIFLAQKTPMKPTQYARFQAGLTLWITKKQTPTKLTLSDQDIESFCRGLDVTADRHIKRVKTLINENEWDALSTLLTQNRRSLLQGNP